MTDSNHAASPSRLNLIVAVLATAGVTGSFMTTMVIPLQPELPDLLDAPPADTAWVVTVTLFVSAILTPIAGKLGDMYGKRRMIHVLLALVLLGSVIAATSSSLIPVIVGRGLQGAGLAVIPVGVSILRDMLPVRRLGAATGLVTASVGLGSALAQPLSAALAERLDWHAVFWAGAVLAAACFVLVWRVVPAHTRRSGGRFDLLGGFGMAVGLFLLLFAISRANEWGWASAGVLVLIASGVIVLVLWGVYELRRPTPLVDLRVTARLPVLFTNVASIGMGFCLFAGNIIYPPLLQLPIAGGGLGLTLLASALTMMPSGFFAVGTSFIAGSFERTVGPKRLLIAGAIVITGVYGTASVLDLTAWQICLVNIGAAVGGGLAFAAMPALIIRSVPASQTGAANGLNALMRSLGTGLAAAILATILGAATLTSDVNVSQMPAFKVAMMVVTAVAVLSGLIAAFIPRTAPLPDGPATSPDSLL